MSENETPDTPVIENATTDELKRLNGLLVRKLIARIEEDNATSSDLSTAMHLVKTNQVAPVDLRVPDYSTKGRVYIDDYDWPVPLEDM